MLEPGAGFKVVPPINIAENKVVTHVAVRLELTRQQRERVRTPPTASRLMLTSAGRPHSLMDVAPATVKKLQEVLAVVAQQFCGCIFNQQSAKVRQLLTCLCFMHALCWLSPCAFR